MDEENLEVADISTSESCQKFSKEVLFILEKLYCGGMDGWGADHSDDISVAINSTGLTISQVKVSGKYIDCKCEWLVGVFNHWWVGVIIGWCGLCQN